jgi:oligopeptide/dipeptide ABC transporter ATP-binding protein
LIEVRGLKKYFPIRGGLWPRNRQVVKAVDDVSLDIYEGETLGVVGESGCGKSTLGRAILRLLEPTGGKVVCRDQNIFDLKGRKLREFRKHMQIIFQDPYSSLNPRMKIGSILKEALKLNKAHTKEQIRQKVAEMIKRVGLDESYLDRYPHELSGGQRQRVGIARAFLVQPEFIVCDEAVSALDVSIQSQIINLLSDLQDEYRLSYLFISHNLSVVKHISNRIAVMYLGQIVELAEKETLFRSPLHPYTESLISAIPVASPAAQRSRQRIILKGDVPNPAQPPSGCRFHTRCPYSKPICQKEQPALRNMAAPGEREHMVSCHFAGELNIRSFTEILELKEGVQ